MPEEKEFFIYEDYDEIDVDYSVRDAPRVPKETITSVPENTERGDRGETKMAKKKAEEKKEPKKEMAKTEAKKKEPVKNEEQKVKKEAPEKNDRRKRLSRLTIPLAIIAIVLVVVVIFYIKGVFEEKNTGEGAAATVNGEVITLQELERSYAAIPEQYKALITKEQVLNQIIEQRLLLQEADREGIAVTEEEIGDGIDEVLRQNLLEQEQFEELAKEQGLTMEEIRDSYKKQIAINKLLEQKVKSKTSVTEGEIKEYYDGLIRASHILVATKEEAEEIKNELDKGGDFAELAKEKSLDEASALRGGDLGEFARGRMVPEFEDAAFNLSVGDVSDIVQTSYGYHIIKRTPKNLTYEGTKDRIRDFLSAPEQQQIYTDYVQRLNDKADIVILLGEAQETVGIGIPEIEIESGEGEEIPELELQETCYGRYGLSYNTVIFYFADWCMEQTPCKSAKNVMDAVQGNFRMVEAGEELMDCFDLENKNLVPQFICAGSGEVKLGSPSEESLRKFVEGCK